jgi:hypothetical protein
MNAASRNAHAGEHVSGFGTGEIKVVATKVN